MLNTVAKSVTGTVFNKGKLSDVLDGKKGTPNGWKQGGIMPSDHLFSQNGSVNQILINSKAAELGKTGTKPFNIDMQIDGNSIFLRDRSNTSFHQKLANVKQFQQLSGVVENMMLVNATTSQMGSRMHLVDIKAHLDKMNSNSSSAWFNNSFPKYGTIANINYAITSDPILEKNLINEFSFMCQSFIGYVFQNPNQPQINFGPAITRMLYHPVVISVDHYSRRMTIYPLSHYENYSGRVKFLNYCGIFEPVHTTCVSPTDIMGAPRAQYSYASSVVFEDSVARNLMFIQTWEQKQFHEDYARYFLIRELDGMRTINPKDTLYSFADNQSNIKVVVHVPSII